MNIQSAKQQIKDAVEAYLRKDDAGMPVIDPVHQRPMFLLGAPGIGKTAIMEQIAGELGIGIVSYSMTHHTRQSALGLPRIEHHDFEGFEYEASEYTMSEIVAAVYDYMTRTGLRQGILFLDEINCVSETLYPSMLQFLQFKKFGKHKVPEGWVVVCAGNPPEYNRSVHEFDIVTLDRMREIDVEPDYASWKNYAQEKGLHPAVTTFLDAKKDCFYKVESKPGGGKSFVTARGWEDLAKIIAGPETDWSAQIQLLANDRITALRAYTNKSGLNYDRVRTAEPGLWANAIVGYGDLLQVQIGGAPALTAGNEGGADGLVSADVTDDTGDVTGTAHQVTTGDFIVSAMTKPLDGLAVSVDWALKGDKISGDTIYGEGVFGAAADVNIGALCGLDFDLGVGVADKYYYGLEQNVLSAQVYGGVDAFDAYAEFVLDGTADDAYRLHLGANINAIENILLNVYGGVGDFNAVEDSFYVGANVGYDVVGGVTLQLNLQYAAYGADGKSYMNSVGGDVSNGAVKAQGFSITPMVKVSF